MLGLKNFALRIAVEILFERNEQKDCNGKPDPQGNAQNIIVIKIPPILLKAKVFKPYDLNYKLCKQI